MGIKRGAKVFLRQLFLYFLCSWLIVQVFLYYFKFLLFFIDSSIVLKICILFRYGGNEKNILRCREQDDMLPHSYDWFSSHFSLLFPFLLPPLDLKMKVVFGVVCNFLLASLVSMSLMDHLIFDEWCRRWDLYFLCWIAN